MKLSKITPAAPPRRDPSPWRAVAELLRATPGVWHKIPDPPKVSTTAIRTGGLGFTPAGAFDAIKRDGILYARFVGEPSPPWRDPTTGLFLPHPDTPDDPRSRAPFESLQRDPDYTHVEQPKA